jgi:hypothetical protein
LIDYQARILREPEAVELREAKRRRSRKISRRLLQKRCGARDSVVATIQRRPPRHRDQIAQELGGESDGAVV